MMSGEVVPTHHEVVDGWSRGLSGADVRSDSVVHVEHVWNTAISIRIAGTRGRDLQALDAIAECCTFFGEVDETFSTFKASSEVSRYRQHGSVAATTREFDDVMAACRRVRSMTGGAFDPWAVRGGYDPSGYVKGWAAGRASGMLASAGFGDHVVNAGGDISARGDEVPGSGHGWPAGILSPRSQSEIVEVVELHDQSMATSGRYARGDHVIDPSSGADSALVIDSATVIGPDPGLADALATSALLRGPGSVNWLVALGSEWSLHLVVGPTVLTHGPAFS